MIMADTRPQVNLRPVAASYAMAGERIIEVSSGAGGCLVSLTVHDGRLRIEVYRADDTVDVIAPEVSAPRKMTPRERELALKAFRL